MKLVLVESPFKHRDRFGLLRNVTYARAALKDCLMRGEAPYASHLLYTQPGVLDDDVEEERTLGIEAGLAWGDASDVALSAVYMDLGVSSGMRYGIARAEKAGRPWEKRSIPGWETALEEDPLDTLLRLGVLRPEDVEDAACTAAFALP